MMELVRSRKGHFKLESGHHGDLWLELDSLFVSPNRLSGFTKELASRLSRYRIDSVCGPLSGGAFLAQLIALELGIDFHHAERLTPSGTDRLYPVKYRIRASLRNQVRGMRVAVVDDAISAGSAIRGTYSDLQACGAEVVAIGALLVLGTSASAFAAENRVPLEALANLPDQIWAPLECPMCASGLPLEARSN